MGDFIVLTLYGAVEWGIRKAWLAIRLLVTAALGQ